jgi:hypothetical protein
MQIFIIRRIKNYLFGRLGAKEVASSVKGVASSAKGSE